MSRLLYTISILFIFCTAAFAAPQVGDLAPDFTIKDINGNSQSLNQYKGKLIVLEWTNFSCPFVKKHYGSHHMQDLQKKYTAKGVVWLSIASSGEGREGYMSNDDALKMTKERDVSSSGFILDTDGTIGKSYGAKTTPHMFVINKEGKIAYMGAIDDNDSTDVEDLKTATNYVSRALDALMNKKAVPEPLATDPYGCSVKYKR